MIMPTWRQANIIIMVKVIILCSLNYAYTFMDTHTHVTDNGDTCSFAAEGSNIHASKFHTHHCMSCPAHCQHQFYIDCNQYETENVIVTLCHLVIFRDMKIEISLMHLPSVCKLCHVHTHTHTCTHAHTHTNTHTLAAFRPSCF